LQQDSNSTFNINKRQHIAKNYLLLPSSKTIQTLTVENYHLREQTIHKEPLPRLAHERKGTKREKIANLLGGSSLPSGEECDDDKMILVLASLCEVNPSAFVHKIKQNANDQ
jgi:hypothetical protein